MKSLIKNTFFVVGFVLLSCTEMLDLEPISSISNSSFWKTESDADGALAGMYATFRSQATNNLFLWGEGRSDVMGSSVAATAFEVWDQNALNADNSGAIFSGAATNWMGMYSVINICNLITTYSPNIDYSNDAKRNNVLAQAYAMRAYAYFVLVRTFGGVPLVTQPTTGELGDLIKPRASVEDVFNQIKSDVDQALALFSNDALPAGRATWSAPAANALKADIYLWTGKRLNGGNNDFTVALNALENINEANLELLPNFGDVFDYDNKGNREIIFAVRRTYEESPEPTIYAWMYALDALLPANIHETNRALISPLGGAPYWGPSEITRNKFTPDDTRRDVSFTELFTVDDADNQTYHSSVVSKFDGTVVGGVRFFIDDYIIYRYADILLMKAEAKNALDQDPSAEINQVRKRAYDDKYEDHVFVSGSKEVNDAVILDERFKELVFEGKRWWDLVRFGKAFELVPSLHGREAETHLLVFPIPTATLSLNTKVEQTDGYEE